MSSDRQLLSVGPEENVRDGLGTTVTIGEKTIALFRVEGIYYAIDNTCPHRGGPLGKGKLTGHEISCPSHGWTWDLRTGANVRNQASKGIELYAVSARNGELFIEIPAHDRFVLNRHDTGD